jgi:hypothetical protein
MLIFAAVIGLYGLLLLIMGPSVPWHMRWQVKGGEKLEPSAEYIVYSRVIGGLMIVAAVCAVFFHFHLQSEEKTNESLKDAWGVAIYGDKELLVDADPPTNRVPDVTAVLAALEGQEQGLQVERKAIVGTDAIGDLGVDFADGDLLLAVQLGTCELDAVVIQEAAESVTVAVTALSKEYVPGTVIPCGGVGYSGRDADDLLVVRVPLEDALGTRELILTPASHAPDGSF